MNKWSEGEQWAINTLRARGARQVQRVGTPVKVFDSGMEFEGEKLYRVVWYEKVAGDARGVLTNGVSVLAETKTVMDKNLTWGHLREHQPKMLSYHGRYGLSLLVWVHETGIYVLHWQFPNENFSPNVDLTPEVAKTLDIMCLETYWRNWVNE